jgi:flagella basal body P-ring formation protein FlgA
MKCKQARIDRILTLMLLPAVALAQSALQPPEDIRRVAEEFVAAQLPAGETGQRLHASADALDPRLRLARCEQQPEGLMPTAARIAERVTVGVACQNPRWTVYVPVRIETELAVLVLRRAMTRGSQPGGDDVESRTLRVPGVSSTYITSVEQLAGRHLRRPVAPGEPLTAELLAADILVRRGQRVTLIATVGGLEVRAQGEAIADAGPTGRVRVLNLASRRIVEGQVESRDQVRVSL